MTLAEYEATQSIMFFRKNGAVAVPYAMLTDIPQLYRLSDYIVTSTTGGCYWLSPR